MTELNIKSTPKFRRRLLGGFTRRKKYLGKKLGVKEGGICMYVPTPHQLPSDIRGEGNIYHCKFLQVQSRGECAILLCLFSQGTVVQCTGEWL